MKFIVRCAALSVTIAGVDEKKAEELVAAAHQVCPCSNASRGNVDVGFAILTRVSKD
jgi:lipoyl-dependent peroxiredoxin